MKEANLITTTIGEIVAADFRAASVFKEAGIDFCCGGKMTLEEACEEKGIGLSELVEKLENPEDVRGAAVHNFNEWQPGFLCDYIVNVHHTYVRKSLPELIFYTQKIAKVHGENHPELLEVADLFSQVNSDLLQHMQKEEEKIFPAVRDVFGNGSERSRTIIRDEMGSLLGEHEFAGGAIDRINVITDGYNLPSDACNSYRITMEMLEKFEDDLHTHVHLENNILFPKTLDKIN
ncbi:MAG TPA: iron-sulfur cluster repair di-iron protein [Bacteroidales bacterium]|nr:iron-sulfur cluster repair di-iron protein [Bacteroidales bacterium]